MRLIKHWNSLLGEIVDTIMQPSKKCALNWLLGHFLPSRCVERSGWIVLPFRSWIISDGGQQDTGLPTLPSTCSQLCNITTNKSISCLGPLKDRGKNLFDNWADVRMDLFPFLWSIRNDWPRWRHSSSWGEPVLRGGTENLFCLDKSLLSSSYMQEAKLIARFEIRKEFSFW